MSNRLEKLEIGHFGWWRRAPLDGLRPPGDPIDQEVLRLGSPTTPDGMSPRANKSSRRTAKKPPEERRRGRPTHIQDAMLSEMRKAIVTGDLRPGDRMPVRTELQQRFDASSITVQRVFDRLVEDGLVEVRGPQGTFVAENPPHLHRVALVFPNGPHADGSWLGFYKAIERAADRLRARGVDLVTCLAQNWRGPTPHFQRLEEECRGGLLRGIIFAHPPDIWRGSPVGDAPMPRIAFTETALPGAIEVGVEGGGFMRRAIEAAAARGCKRPAVIDSSQGMEVVGRREQWFATFAAAGIPVRPQWLLGCNLDYPESASGLARLLGAPWSGERPDVILIADDNFEQPVLAGLLAEGVDVGRDMLVIAHANFPCAPPAHPVLRIGFDTEALLREALVRIDALRRGETPAPYRQPATFPDGT